MEELLYPLLKVPFEKANKSFRLFHKYVSREIAAVQKSVLALQEEQSSAQHALAQDTIASLEQIADRIRNAQVETKQFVAEQQKDINSCVLRSQYVHNYQELNGAHAVAADGVSRISASGASLSSWNATNTMMKNDHQSVEKDRLVADYLLSYGYIKSSKTIQETKGRERRNTSRPQNNNRHLINIGC
jgi:hypothetical protein